MCPFPSGGDCVSYSPLLCMTLWHWLPRPVNTFTRVLATIVGVGPGREMFNYIYWVVCFTAKNTQSWQRSYVNKHKWLTEGWTTGLLNTPRTADQCTWIFILQERLCFIDNRCKRSHWRTWKEVQKPRLKCKETIVQKTFGRRNSYKAAGASLHRASHPQLQDAPAQPHGAPLTSSAGFSETGLFYFS